METIVIGVRKPQYRAGLHSKYKEMRGFIAKEQGEVTGWKIFRGIRDEGGFWLN